MNSRFFSSAASLCNDNRQWSRFGSYEICAFLDSSSSSSRYSQWQWNRSTSLNAFHIVGGQHASHARSLDRPEHPAFVDWLNVHDDVVFVESDFVVVLRVVVVHRLVHRTLHTHSTLQTCANRSKRERLEHVLRETASLRCQQNERF